MNINVLPKRKEALEAGFTAMRGRIGDLSFDQFCASLKSWKIRAFCDGDKAVGMLMTKGNELHVAVLPEVRGKWLSRRLIREVIGPLLDKHGFAKTSVMPDNYIGKDFVSRLGFNDGHIEALREGFSKGTFDPTTALVVAGTQLVGGAIGADAAGNAASQQANAANRASDTQMQMFNTVNQQQAPYRQAGQNALSALQRGLGIGGTTPPQGYISPARPGTGEQYQWTGSNWVNMAGAPISQSDSDSAQSLSDVALKGQQPQTGSNGLADGYFTHQFDANDLNTNLAPNYQFQLQQGQGAAANALNLTGGLGGNFAKGLVDYTTNKAGDAYQSAFNNYTANQSNIFNRLSNIAGLGQTANQATANAGVTTAGNVGANQMAAGAAQAAGTVGQANALSGGLTNAASWYSLPAILNAGKAGDPSLMAG